MESYSHFREYQLNPIGVEQIKKIIKEKKAIYNLNVDKTKNKFDFSHKLVVSDIAELPNVIKDNFNLYKDWIEKK